MSFNQPAPANRATDYPRTRGKTTPSAPHRKPIWPYPDIVKMTAHTGSGQWRKRRNRQDFYFGVLSDPDAALARWRAEWPSILTGGVQAPVIPSAAPDTVRGAVALFLDSKLSQHERGELAWQTYRTYRWVGRKVIESLGANTPINAVTPDHFRRLLNSWSTMSGVRRQDNVVKTRTIVKWANDHLSADIRTGPDFKAPPLRLIRSQRAGRKGRVFTAHQFWTLVRASHDPRLTAALWLGLNCGFLNADLAHLRRSDIKGAWIDTTRHKTAADRRAKLWPETIAAIKQLPKTRDLLITGYDGLPVVRRNNDDLARWFDECRQRAKVIGSYRWLRYTFATVAAETGDDHARSIIMGHVIDGVPERYVLEFPSSRLVRVADHVRKWLLKGRRGRERRPSTDAADASKPSS